MKKFIWLIFFLSPFLLYSQELMIPAEQKEWSKSAGHEAELRVEKGIIKFRVKLDFKDGGKYPLGWPLIKHYFRPPLKMEYDAIEFDILTHSPLTLPHPALRMTFYNEKGREVYVPIVPVKRDKWVKVSIPLSRIKGYTIRNFNIYIAEKWYKDAGFPDGEEIEFLIKGMRFVKKGSNKEENKVLLDGIEEYSLFDKEWNVSGGPEGALFLEDKIVRSGKHSLRWNIKIDYHRGADPRYPVGWLFLRRFFYSPQDWSGYDTLEFYIYIPSSQKFKGLKYTIRCVGEKKPRYMSLYPDAVTPGKWSRIRVPLNSFRIRGGLDKVISIVFYIPENWYEDGEELNFYFDDFSLLKTTEKSEKGWSEPLRKADTPLKPCTAYKDISNPLIYPVVPLEFIYPNTDLSSRKPVKEFRVKAAKGEIRPLTFAILAGKEDIKDLKVKVSNLRKGEDIIPGDLADVRVVKVWEQAALHWEVFSPKDKILVPELLLKDDRIKIEDKRDESGRYIPPSVLSYPFGTDIPAHTLKQIWINFSIPSQQPAGIYEGRVILKARTGLKAISVPLKIEVLPFSLPSPKLIYGMYYRWRIHAKRPVFDWPEELYIKDLEEFKRVGFNSISIYHDNLSSTERMLEIYKKMGFEGPVVILGGREESVAKEIMRYAKKMGIEIYFYGYDEPNNPERMAKHIEISRLFHSLGGKVMVACTPSTAKTLKEKGEPLEWANLAAGGCISTYTYLENLRRGRTERVAPVITIYWQFYIENPTLNRLSSGYYPWVSKIDGIFPYEYQGFPRSVAYSKDERFIPRFRGKKNRTFRSWCVAYPSKEGPVSTLQWEGMRLGINDVKYLTYLQELLKKTDKKDLVKDIQRSLEDILNPFSYLPPDPSPYTNPYMPPQRFEETREKIIELILKIRKR